MQAPAPSSLVASLLALQFVVFGWRIAREVSLGDEDRRTWLLVSDLLNLVSMLAVVALCVVLPLRVSEFPLASRVALGGGYVLMAFTPLMIAGHYRLFSRQGRSIYKEAGRDYPWVTGQEAFFVGVGLISTTAAAWVIASN